MPIEIDSDPQEAVLTLRITGVATRDDNLIALRNLAECVESPGLQGWRYLIDVSHFAETNLDSNDMLGLTRRLSRVAQREGDMTIALCAPSGSFGYAMARMFQAYATMNAGLDTQVFEDEAAARDWLGPAPEGISTEADGGDCPERRTPPGEDKGLPD